MTTLLKQAIAAIKQLPPPEQDAIARRLLADLADNAAWDAQFRATTDDQWDRLTASVRRDIASDQTSPLEELFPPDMVLPILCASVVLAPRRAQEQPKHKPEKGAASTLNFELSILNSQFFGSDRTMLLRRAIGGVDDAQGAQVIGDIGDRRAVALDRVHQRGNRADEGIGDP